MKEKQNTIESTIDDQRKITCTSTMTVSFPNQVTSLLQMGSNSIKLNYDGNKTVAQAVAKRQHKLDGQELVVSLYTPPVPPPSYPNKLLIKGLNPKITFDVLDLYLEARMGITLVEGSMTYHAEQNEVVLVTVNGDIDFAKLEEACRLKALEGSHLRVSPVPISNCVLVSNISDTVTVDMVSLYFENEKRSNGGQVDKVEMFSTQNYWLVYFADYK
ncbi:hypothetical protein DPMN_033784, partial [Dreissena polymorpha]